MRIRDVVCHVLDAPLSRDFGWSLATTDRRTAMLVEIVAEDGLAGWGESYGCRGPMPPSSSTTTSRG